MPQVEDQILFSMLAFGKLAHFGVNGAIRSDAIEVVAKAVCGGVRGIASKWRIVVVVRVIALAEIEVPVYLGLADEPMVGVDLGSRLESRYADSQNLEFVSLRFADLRDGGMVARVVWGR